MQSASTFSRQEGLALNSKSSQTFPVFATLCTRNSRIVLGCKFLRNGGYADADFIFACPIHHLKFARKVHGLRKELILDAILADDWPEVERLCEERGKFVCLFVGSCHFN